MYPAHGEILDLYLTVPLGNASTMTAARAAAETMDFVAAEALVTGCLFRDHWIAPPPLPTIKMALNLIT